MLSCVYMDIFNYAPPPIFSIFLCDIFRIIYRESIMFLIYDTWHISYDICCGLRILYNV